MANITNAVTPSELMNTNNVLFDIQIMTENRLSNVIGSLILSLNIHLTVQSYENKYFQTLFEYQVVLKLAHNYVDLNI